MIMVRTAAPDAIASATVALRVRTLAPDEHREFLASQESASFLQTPAWGAVKRDWGSESIGWVDDSDQIVGAGLVLYRQIPRMRRSLAYVPEGPVIDWADPDLGRWLAPFTDYLASRGAFGVRLGPPVVTRRWQAATVKQAISAAESEAGPARLGDVPADVVEPVGSGVTQRLASLGWRPPPSGTGFAAGQPRYVFWLPLAGQDEDGLLAGMNQQWRRNIRKAIKAGVEVTVGTTADLPEFHELYAVTARRDRFTPRPLSYFQEMFRALNEEDPDRIRLYLAHHEGDLVAATIGVRVGTHAWYSYGASSTDKREVRGSNACQWRMITDALAAGAKTYDLRGITDTLDASDHHFGLLQFKVGTGGEAVEYAGEWDLPISRVLYSAFDLYMRRRGG